MESVDTFEKYTPSNCSTTNLNSVNILFKNMEKRELFEKRSDLNGGEIMLDFYNDIDWVMCLKTKQRSSYGCLNS